MGKSAGKTDIGESAPCSNIGRAQVRKAGSARQSPVLSSDHLHDAAILLAPGWGMQWLQPIRLASPMHVPSQAGF